MRRLAVLVLVAACGRTPTRAERFALVALPAVAASDERDKVLVEITPALAVGPAGMLVAWSAPKPEDEVFDRIVVRHLKLDATPIGDAAEIGAGVWPSIAVGRGDFVVAWEQSIERAHPVLGLRAISFDRGVATSGSPATDVRIEGTPALVGVADDVVALACSDDPRAATVVRGASAVPHGERLDLAHGCNAVRAASLTAPGRAIVLARAEDLTGTEVVEVGRSSVRPLAFVRADCNDALPIGDRVVLACVDRAFGRALQLRSSEDDESFATARTVDVDTGGGVLELRAVPVRDRILMAWTIETARGFELRAALVDADGRARSATLDVAPSPASFALAGDGETAWLSYVNERQLDRWRYLMEVMVVRLAVTGTASRAR